jgi:hypothetical protein
MMAGAELLTLRGVLALRRGALIDRLASNAATDGLPILDPGFLRLLADTHTAIAAVDAELIEPEGDAE